MRPGAIPHGVHLPSSSTVPGAQRPRASCGPMGPSIRKAREAGDCHSALPALLLKCPPCPELHGKTLTPSSVAAPATRPPLLSPPSRKLSASLPSGLHYMCIHHTANDFLPHAQLWAPRSSRVPELSSMKICLKEIFRNEGRFYLS